MYHIRTANELIDNFPNASVKEKNNIIESWTELHYQAFGSFPNRYELMILADWLLEDTLKDVSRSKVQNEAYPILSKPQLDRRNREMSMTTDLVDVLHQKRINNLPTRKQDSKNNEY